MSRCPSCETNLPQLSSLCGERMFGTVSALGRLVESPRSKVLAAITAAAVGTVGCQRDLSPPTREMEARLKPSTDAKVEGGAGPVSEAATDRLVALKPHHRWKPDDGKRAACETHGSPDAFFHEGAFTSVSLEVDSLMRSWMSAILAEVGEPSLSCQRPTAASYRLSRLYPSGYITTVRVDAHDVTVKSFGRHSVTEIPHLQIVARRPVFTAERRLIADELRTSEFWSVPAADYIEQVSVRDSVQWVIEVRDAERYHVVTRPGGYRVARDLPADKRLALIIELLLRLGRT